MILRKYLQNLREKNYVLAKADFDALKRKSRLKSAPIHIINSLNQIPEFSFLKDIFPNIPFVISTPV